MRPRLKHGRARSPRRSLAHPPSPSPWHPPALTRTLALALALTLTLTLTLTLVLTLRHLHPQPHQVASFISLIHSEKMMQEQLREANIDLEKMPLGSISDKQARLTPLATRPGDQA